MHICEIPRERARRRWWTYDERGQLWHKSNGHWRMTEAEAHA